jgi:hypothetical protein
MDKSVKRVTVIEGAGENRNSKVVYEGKSEHDESDIPPIERAVRHVVNAALIAAQVAYDNYIERAKKGKTKWVFQPGRDRTVETRTETDIGGVRGTYTTRID